MPTSKLSSLSYSPVNFHMLFTKKKSLSVVLVVVVVLLDSGEGVVILRPCNEKESLKSKVKGEEEEGR